MSRKQSNKKAARPSEEELLLNSSIREKLFVRVGYYRLFFIILPASILVTVQTTYLMMSMFEVASYWEYWIMYSLCGVINVLSMMFIMIQTMNAKAEELHEGRAEMVNKIKPDLKVQDKDEREYLVFQKRREVLRQINKEATLYGLWVSNLTYLSLYVTLSFGLFRYMSARWNYWLTTLSSVIMTQYLPFYFVREPSYNHE